MRLTLWPGRGCGVSDRTPALACFHEELPQRACQSRGERCTCAPRRQLASLRAAAQRDAEGVNVVEGSTDCRCGYACGDIPFERSLVDDAPRACTPYFSRRQ